MVANQINLEDYSGKKTERNHDFLFLSFISLTEIAQSFKTSKKNFTVWNLNLIGVVLV